MEIGLIGLGNMGRNLAMNLDDKGYRLHVYNRTGSKTKDLVQKHPKIMPHYTVKDLCSNIKSEPKVIILMLTAGPLIDDMLKELHMYLNEQDIVIDIGNSYFKDTIRREKECKFIFVGAGISGGELGARHGGSIMVGCKASTWEKIKNMLYDLSTDSRLSKGKCCDRFGENGAGHFVKMVHNGIEYCDMDVISECYLLLKKMGYNNDEISKYFCDWNEKELNSYLMEIAGKILKKKENGEYLIDKVEDSAQQKGTGKACIIEAVELSVPSITIVEAVFSRIISSKKSERINIHEKLKTNDDNVENLDVSFIYKTIKLCRAISYVQGFNLLKAAMKEYKWDNNLSEICNVWSDGCILRGSFLKVMKEMVNEKNDNLEATKIFQDIFTENIEALRQVVIFSARKGVSIPAISSCLNYIFGIRTKESHGNMIQSMRDCFGGHTVIFKGETEPRHINWLNE